MLHYTIEELLRNNQAWAAQKKAIEASYFDELDRGQTPPYLYVGCSDSRLPLTNFTQTEPGEIFVHRNIANQVCLTDINFLSVLDYAIVHLHVEHIIVCGHYNCGGIIAVLEGTTTGLVDNWVNPIRELYLEHQREIDGLNTREQRINRLAELNVITQVHNLYQTPILRKGMREGTAPKIHGWVLNLKTGLIQDLKIQNPSRDLWSIPTEAIPN
jgi:carbonic anhydrase